MNKYILIILSCIGLVSCSTTSAIKFSNNETLIRVNYKMPQNGYFTFLVLVNENEVKEIIYSYSVHVKNRKCWCSKTSERVYNINEYCKQNDCSGFKTAKEFVLGKQYYICFADNFLDMTNDEKIDLLNEISNKRVENCQIEKVLDVVVKNDNLYFMQIKFSHCDSKELRETLIMNELINRFPLTRNKTINVEEYLGKMYNEYKYEIKVE